MDLMALMTQGEPLPKSPEQPTSEFPNPYSSLPPEQVKALSEHWHGNKGSPRRAVGSAMVQSGHSALEPKGRASSYKMLQAMLNGHALPTVLETTAYHNAYRYPIADAETPAGRAGFITFNPDQYANDPAMYDPTRSLRHEVEHARQPANMSLVAHEIGPSLGDVIHNGRTWYATDHRVTGSLGRPGYRVQLTPAYSPTLGFLLSQSKQHGYPQKTMDQLLATEPGQQWLKMRAAEYNTQKGK